MRDAEWHGRWCFTTRRCTKVVAQATSPQHVAQLCELALDSACRAAMLHADGIRILASLLTEECAFT